MNPSKPWFFIPASEPRLDQRIQRPRTRGDSPDGRVSTPAPRLRPPPSAIRRGPPQVPAPEPHARPASPERTGRAQSVPKGDGQELCSVAVVPRDCATSEPPTEMLPPSLPTSHSLPIMSMPALSPETKGRAFFRQCAQEHSFIDISNPEHVLSILVSASARSVM